MTSAQKFPYKGHAIFPQVVKLESGQYAACFTIKHGYDGSGETRYVREMPTTEFASEDEAIAYILDFSGDWVDQNLM